MVLPTEPAVASTTDAAALMTGEEAATAAATTVAAAAATASQRGDFDDRSGRDGPWDGGRRGGGGGGPPHMEFREPDPSDATRRLKLSLKTRSVAVPTNTVANTSQTSSIFVGAEPR